MRTCVAVTDLGWSQFLASRPELDEANFWLPSGGPKTFRIVTPGEWVLFKTHHPHNRIVGGGVLSDYRRLPLTVAWDAFGAANGADSLDEMRRAIGRYRKVPSDDPLIGCLMLRDVVFFPPNDQFAGPADFAKNVVQWKGYDLRRDTDPVVVEAHHLANVMRPGALGAVDLRFHHDGPMFGAPRLVAPRLGQGAFSAVVAEAYHLQCAVTGAKIRPVLQAAHIRPVQHQGEHRVDNGLLLRADVHLLFDAGYLGVNPHDYGLQVSRELRRNFGNGEEFYAREGAAITTPERTTDHPNREFLEWHMDTVFRA